jgi:hypothetical protein
VTAPNFRRTRRLNFVDYYRIESDGQIALHSRMDSIGTSIISDCAQYGGATPGGIRYVWADDWNRATRTLQGISAISADDLNISDDGIDVEPAPEPINQVGRVGRWAARCAAVVRNASRTTGAVTAVVMCDQVTQYRSAAAAARATGFTAAQVRRYCQAGRPDAARLPGGTVFFWSRDWNNHSEIPEGESLAGLSETPDENGIFIQAGGVFRGDVRNRIGLITRCGLGHYVRMDTAAGQLDYFHLELPNVHAWIRASANGAEARPEVDEDEGPQPNTIRQPDGGRAWFDHRGRLRTGSNPDDIG